MGIALLSSVSGTLGCASRSLSRNTVQTTGTVMEIQYRSVLANLAMMSLHPETFPNHVHLADGVVQISDRAGIGQSGGFTTVASADFGIEQFGPNGQREVTVQWGTDATTDPERLFDLQAIYRVTLGLPPLPQPNSIRYLREDKKSDSNEGKSPEKAAIQAIAYSQVAGGSGSSKGSGSKGDESRRVPIEVLLTDVPGPGWYHLGCKKDVPANACYVGHWEGRYAWVTADGVPDLARLTLTMLMVVKLKPGEKSGKSSLAVTGN